ncbi:hypothetical protein C5610_03505 [Idiomarina sp. OT37-5b]|jgi:uncharacterized lipoprotein YmbA|uniref:ABC-type transport auxiliary lipoprotein component domain-containing protein n=1 Tax=Idiomarina aquatica TaxID=1327752 RepID=A0AA94JDL5_9GAMM|nr:MULTISPECIES: ABC-type transport auxiliary lipoprotein family protein [Idiomarina]AVJ55450.1 hypothetical protein C5610_03505 [Idiomarina sp. OT37-5b]RUO44927.1 hypothetical protein CWE23_02550 [Idiomarina aquatica]
MINMTLKATAGVLLALTLSACGSVPQTQRSDYRLPILNQATERFCPASARQVVVSDLMLSDGILLQRSETRIHAARNHRWSGSLEQQLQQSAQRVLNQPHCDGQLVITVMDFYGDNQGHAVVSGHWHYQQGEQQLSGSFHQRQALQQDGYDALVSALNRAWSKTLSDIKSAIPN